MSSKYFTCSQRSCQAKPQTFSAICSSVYTAPFCCGAGSNGTHVVGAAQHRQQAHWTTRIMGLTALAAFKTTQMSTSVVEDKCRDYIVHRQLTKSMLLPESWYWDMAMAATAWL
jgi:hypothetical protein